MFVRHGESSNNVHAANGQEAYTKNRVPDPELSSRGMEQARRVGELMTNPQSADPFFGDPSTTTEVWVSPHLRALSTAAPFVAGISLASASPPQVMVTTELFEAGGIFDGLGQALGGLTRAEMAASFPTFALPPEVGDSGWYVGPGRETNGECRSRASSLVARLRARALALTTDETIVAVTHDYMICALLEVLLPGSTGGGAFPSSGGAGELEATPPMMKPLDPNRKFTAWCHYNTGYVYKAAVNCFFAPRLDFVAHLNSFTAG